jgi:geranylgeranyl pyrophosphate synthase
MTSEPLGVGVWLEERRREVDDALLRVLPPEGASPADLVSAMRYSTLAGGKRLRPILCLAAAEACGDGGLPPRGEMAEAASALELVHTYSLVHDDLPCMDDDTLRRGKPTCHVVFGEATALLAGDALQTLAFEVLATRPRGDAFAPRRAAAVGVLAEAIGVAGMAGGQALDLAAEGKARDANAQELLREIHARKTGRLLRGSVVLGAILSGAPPERCAAVARYGEEIGLLFQIADDLLDVTSTASVLGKTAGKDVAQEKLTYPALFGIDGALAERDRALESALAAARGVEGGGGRLAALAEFAATRES